MKKFLPHILIAFFCLTVFLIGIKPTYAASAANTANLFEILSDPYLAVATILGYATWMLFYTPASGILWLAGQIFNFSLNLSLNSGALGKDIVSIGWAISRDVANLFFIFVLLYISIATILRLSGYGAKELLVRLVIVALLVNFSLVFAGAVIDASNILALSFYDSITMQEGSTVIQTGNGIIGTKDVSAVFMAGFAPQKLFLSAEFQKALDDNGGSVAIIVNTIVKFILAAIIALMAAFILLAAAGLFIIRTVILWLIMILAPIAFISMILPATRGIASRWWSALFKQSFFAPAFLFFYYLVARMVNVGFFEQMSVTNSGATGLAAILEGSLTTFMQFSVLGILLIACLVVAQEMGAYGANTAMALGKKGSTLAAGYVGQTAARYTIAPLAQRAAASPTMKNIAASFPRLGGVALRTLQRGAQAGGIEKRTEQRTKTGLGLAPEGRAEYLTQLGKGMVGGKFIGADKRTQTEMIKKMSPRERVEMLERAKTEEQKTTVKNLLRELPVEEQEKTETIRKERESATQLNAALTEAKTNPTDKGRAETLMTIMTAPQLNKIMDEKGEKLTTAFEALKNFGADLKTATQNIAKINPSLAGHIASQPRMQSTLRIMFSEKSSGEKPGRQAGFTSPEL
ncbi:MAG: hypothetical protein AAB378_03090 [Patescibacteria group bacterium]